MKGVRYILLSSILSSISAIMVKRSMNQGAEWKSVTYSFLLGAVLPIVFFWGNIMYRGIALTLNLPAMLGEIIWGSSLLIYNYYLSNHGFIYTNFLNRAMLSVGTIILGIMVLGEYPSLR